MYYQLFNLTINQDTDRENHVAKGGKKEAARYREKTAGAYEILKGAPNVARG